MAIAGPAGMTRRQVLKAGLTCGIAASTAGCAEIAEPQAAAASEALPLREVSRSKAPGYGAAVQANQLVAGSGTARIFAAECSSLTPELAMKWQKLARNGDDYDFRDMDRIARFAHDNDMALRGHTLLWHDSVPAWAEELMLRTRQWRHVRRHIETVVSRYGAQVEQWDVVNEPIEVGYRSDGLRANVFLNAFGPDYIDWAFWTAHEYAPDALLFLNEYGLEYDTPEDGRRRLALMSLLAGLRSRGVPVGGLGIQAHLDLRKGTIYEDGIYGLVRDAGNLGLKIAITELDVREADNSLSVAERDRRVADETRRYLDVVLQFACVESVTTWGLSDSTSWLRYGKDGMAGNRGLPYDEYWQPKPMRQAIREAIGDPARRA